MTTTTIEEELAELEAKRAVICAQIGKLSDEATELYDQCQKLREEIAERELARSDQPNWSLLLEEQSSMVMYKALEKALHEFGMSSFGYRPATMQRAVKISLYKHHPESATRLQKTLEGLEKILPYIKPIDGWKIIGILESTHSEHGVLDLHVGENACEVRKITYGSERIVFKADSLLKALEYIQKHHPYDSEDEE